MHHNLLEMLSRRILDSNHAGLMRDLGFLLLVTDGTHCCDHCQKNRCAAQIDQGTYNNILSVTRFVSDFWHRRASSLLSWNCFTSCWPAAAVTLAPWYACSLCCGTSSARWLCGPGRCSAHCNIQQLHPPPAIVGFMPAVS